MEVTVEEEIEAQLQKVLNKISLAEKTKNRALERQTARLFRALFFMKTLVTGPRKSLIKGV